MLYKEEKKIIDSYRQEIKRKFQNFQTIMFNKRRNIYEGNLINI